jgi:nucleoside-diphosphate-sugar epimerase
VGVLRIVVTGGSGRFGTVVVKLLAAQGHEIVLLDRQRPKDELPAGVRFRTSDLGDAAALRGLFGGFDALVHLAAIPNPLHHPPETVFANNVVTTYNVLLAAAETGVTKICLASSINAIGGAWSRRARYDYLAVDEAHPSYNEDAYSLSKWVGEAQADSIARRYDGLTISSLRLHGLNKRVERTDASLAGVPAELQRRVVNHLWGYVDIDSAARAVALSLQATFIGHEAFFIVAPRTIFSPDIASRDMAARHYPDVPLRAALHENAGFYDCAKAGRLLGWRHEDL